MSILHKQKAGRLGIRPIGRKCHLKNGVSYIYYLPKDAFFRDKKLHKKDAYFLKKATCFSGASKYNLPLKSGADRGFVSTYSLLSLVLREKEWVGDLLRFSLGFSILEIVDKKPFLCYYNCIKLRLLGVLCSFGASESTVSPQKRIRL